MIPSLYDFTTHPEYLGLQVSLYQRVLLKALDGEPLTSEEFDVWVECTGRERYMETRFGEATIIAGARSGKDSRIAVPSLLHGAIFGDYEAQLAKGERGICVLVAQDGEAVRVAFTYAKDYVLASKLLRQMVADRGDRERRIILTNGLEIQCFNSTAKSLRGWAIPTGIMDELAFFRADNGSDCDQEIQTSIRRGMVGFGERGRLIKITTPFLRTGVAYQDFQTYWGQETPDVVVWKAPSQKMNPTLDPRALARQFRLDPLRARREFDAEFGEDVEAFLPGAWIEAAVVDGRTELPPAEGRRYLAAVDPSGGSGDAFTLAIVHVEEGQRLVQDVMKSWAGSRTSKVELSAVVAEIAEVVRRYGLYTVIGDKYAGQWPAQEFRKVGIHYQPAEIDKSRAYLEVEPVLAQQRLELLDHLALARELRLLEKRYKPGGKTPTIDHPKSGHDDCANAVALAVASLAKSLHPAAAVMGTPGQAPSEAGAEPEMGFWRPRMQPSPIAGRDEEADRADQVVGMLGGARPHRGRLRMFR